MLAKYAPQYPCMAQGLADWIPRVEKVFSGGSFHITMELVPPRPAYHPGEGAALGRNRPASCDVLPDPNTSQSHPLPGKKFDDGTDNVYGYPSNPSTALLEHPREPHHPVRRGRRPGLRARRHHERAAGRREPAHRPRTTGVRRPRSRTALDDGPAAATPSAIQTLLYGPMLRGTVVSTQ